jgi:DNA-binding transcriptional LysR family regulator
MDLNKLRIFHAVAQLGGITSAASELKMGPSTISMSISALENDIGHKLFTRHYRGLRLTSDGEILLNSTKKMLDEFNIALSLMSENVLKTEGNLTIATSFGIASADWFLEKLSRFFNEYPDIKLKIVDYKQEDIDSISADIFICPFVYNHLDLIQKDIHVVHFKLFASKSYVRKFGMPKTPDDLDNHRLIAFSKELNNPFNDADSLLHIGRDQKNPRSIFLELNNNISLLKMVKRGEGIAALAVDESDKNEMIEILPNSEITKKTCLTYYKRHEKMSAIKLFSESFFKNK